MAIAANAQALPAVTAMRIVRRCGWAAAFRHSAPMDAVPAIPAVAPAMNQKNALMLDPTPCAAALNVGWTHRQVFVSRRQLTTARRKQQTTPGKPNTCKRAVVGCAARCLLTSRENTHSGVSRHRVRLNLPVAEQMRCARRSACAGSQTIGHGGDCVHCALMDTLTYLIYGLPTVILLVWFASRRKRLEQRSHHTQRQSRDAGLQEPASLHPVIDPSRCIGCGSCVKACPEEPEHHVLGIIGGRAQLVGPGDCIGHGACRAACPVDAITLVFGTERRGTEIPVLTPQFETSVSGLFIAGELGGMGLIRNALEQGRQAVEAIHARRPKGGNRFDLVIVGAGPAGFAASLTALSKRMRCITVEQESLGGCVFQYPRGKLVMTAPATVPLIGKVNLRQTSKEALLGFWQEVERKTGVKINYRERVDDIVRDGDGFIVRTSRGEYRAHSVLLAIGRRGTPRKLGVPGEELPKVVYRLIDPQQYEGRHVLVVGGGDSALEAAASIAESGGSSVVLSYRGESFGRAKQGNRDRLKRASEEGRLRVMLNSNVTQIAPNSVAIEQQGRILEVANDAVIVNAGGVLPGDFLRRVGIDVETKYGTA